MTKASLAIATAKAYLGHGGRLKMDRTIIALLAGAALFAAGSARADTVDNTQEIAGRAHLVFRNDKAAPGLEGQVTVVQRRAAVSATNPLQTASFVSESWREAPGRRDKRQD